MSENTDPLRVIPAGAKWRMTLHLAHETGGILEYDCPSIEGLAMVVSTPKLKGVWGTGVATYFSRTEEHKTLDEALKALGYKFRGGDE